MILAFSLQNQRIYFDPIILVNLLIEDPEKFNEIESKNRAALVPKLHNFK